MLAALSPKDKKIAQEVGRKLAKASMKEMRDQIAAMRAKRAR